MVILEEPYVSELMVDWLTESQHPVLANEFARSLPGKSLNLVDESEAIERIDGGERLYTNSENALAWVISHAHNKTLNHAIAICKDKSVMRELLASVNPSVFYRAYCYEELATVDVATLPLPVVLKPSVGFCSLGVSVIESPADWDNALGEIRAQADTWRKQFPGEVVDLGTYLVESYITGDEYALDAYFDEVGKAHILAVFHHEFASAEDTSDRLYNESAEIIDAMEPVFRTWLNEVNELFQARNFPFHAEVRVQPNRDVHGAFSIIPIEFNPLRFAGLCFTDLSWYAWGKLTYQAFLEHESIDLAGLASKHPQEVFTMALLKPESDDKNVACFDYEKFCSHFTSVLAMRRFDVAKTGIYGCLFLKTDPSTADERDFLLHAKLADFCTDCNTSLFVDSVTR